MAQLTSEAALGAEEESVVPHLEKVLVVWALDSPQYQYKTHLRALLLPLPTFQASPHQTTPGCLHYNYLSSYNSTLNVTKREFRSSFHLQLNG